MIRSSKWIAGVLPAIFVFACAAAAQTGATVTSKAHGILPTGLGDAVDRGVAKIREATAKFQTSQAAEAAGVADQCWIKGGILYRDMRLLQRIQHRCYRSCFSTAEINDADHTGEYRKYIHPFKRVLSASCQPPFVHISAAAAVQQMFIKCPFPSIFYFYF